MTIRNLDHALRPHSVAVIGASAEEGSVGSVLTRNVLAGGFAGPVYLVNPRRARIAGRKCYADVAALPEAPELAVIATPPSTVPALIAELGAKGTRAVVVITAGLSSEIKQAALNAARPRCLRIIGPNCLGIAVPGIGLHANFGLSRPSPRQARFPVPVGRAHHRHFRLGRGARDWFLLCGVDGRHGGRRCRRSARLSCRRHRHRRDPALSRDYPGGAQVHVGGALGRTRQAGDRDQVGPQ
jgi:predicted CoA-binding protein